MLEYLRGVDLIAHAEEDGDSVGRLIDWTVEYLYKTYSRGRWIALQEAGLVDGTIEYLYKTYRRGG